MEDIDEMMIGRNEEIDFYGEAPQSYLGNGDDADDDAELADWVIVCGNLAVVTSMLVSLAPLPTLAEMWQNESVGSLPLLPFTIMIIKALVWIVYGVLKSQLMVWMPNVLGLPVAIVCFCVYIRYSPQESPQLPGKVSHHVFLIFGLLAITLLSATLLPPWIAVHVVGIQAVLICIVRDWSPLIRLADVMKRKNADALSAPLSIAAFFECSFWGIYFKLAIGDALLYVPNAVRFCFNGLQVILIVMYGSWNRARRKKRPSHTGSHSDTFKGLVDNVESDDDETVTTTSTMSTAGTAASRSIEMQDTCMRKQNSKAGDEHSNEPSMSETKPPMRHRHPDTIV